jgi:hypothetical protein
MAAMQIPQLDPMRPARPFQLPSSRFDGSTGPRIIGPRTGSSWTSSQSACAS